MSRTRNTERLKEIRPKVMPSTLAMSKLAVKKLFSKIRREGVATWNDGLDYAEYIHALWNTLLQHKEYGVESQHIENMLGKGDAIQILSDIVLEDRRASQG